MRKRIFEIIDIGKDGDRISQYYDFFMIAVIMISIIPLAMRDTTPLWKNIEHISVGIFIVDYVFRFITADYKFSKHSVTSFIKYPFTPMAIIDIISILPSFIIMNQGFRLLRLMRLARAFRVFRVFKTLRYSKSFEILIGVIRRSKESLVAVGVFAMGYLLVCALIMYNAEPESFGSFFDAVYWATVSLTTVGYGDIYAVSTIGKIITMISSIFGIAIVALPAGIITAGYMRELDDRKAQE